MKSLFDRIAGYLQSRPVAKKLISFGLIGVINTVVDFGMFTFFYAVIALPLVLSNMLGWYIAVSCSYVMNTMITFREESGRVLRRRDYFHFALSGIVGAVLSTTALVVVSHFMPVLVAKLISIAVALAANFSMSHFVVFRPTLDNRPS